MNRLTIFTRQAGRQYPQFQSTGTMGLRVFTNVGTATGPSSTGTPDRWFSSPSRGTFFSSQVRGSFFGK